MSKLDKDQVIENFTKAYLAANGKEPNIEAAGGWYSIDGDKNVRLAALEEMTAELSAKPAAKTKAAKPAAEKKEAKPASEKKAAKPAAKKKVAKSAAKKKAAKKKAAKSKKSNSGFSVKAFWAEKITQQNPGAILPR